MEPTDVIKSKGEFFRVLGQTDRSQIATMTIESGKDSGPEELHTGDQIIYIVEGSARVLIGEKTHTLSKNMIAIVPSKTRHHIYNEGTGDLFFLTIYTPPEY